MKDWTINGSKVVGLKQTLRAISNKEVSTVYLANNADDYIRVEVEKACSDNSIELVSVETMKELGNACGIDREASTAAILKK